MKVLSIIILFLLEYNLYAQDTTKSWIRSIDTLAFKVHHSKRFIPKNLYSLVEIEHKREIANLHGNFNAGCTGLGKHKRLNWIAKDSYNHWIICISYGGVAFFTKYYFIDQDKGYFQVKRFYFYGIVGSYYSFSQAIQCLLSGQYELAD